MKRFFIAIGSTAVDALAVLVNRYRECGELLEAPETGDYHDFFVGIDSDESKVQEFQALDSNRSYLCGIQLEEDEATAELSHKVQPCWQVREPIPKSGVGGIRRKSFRTLKMLKDPFFGEILRKIEPNDLVILIGSAFGGTSTGAYWNLATYLRERVNAVEPNSHALFGFVIFPDEQKWRQNFSGMSMNTAYASMSSNVCDFLRDMGENRILLSILDKSLRGAAFRFAPISLALSKIDGFQRDVPDESFGVLKGDVERGRPSNFAELSYLPTESTFLISTNGIKSSKAVSAIVADEIFLFARIGLGTDPAAGKTITANIVDSGSRPKEGVVPECFSEFNFIAARTLRKKLLTQFIYEQAFYVRIHAFGDDTVNTESGSETWKKLRETIRRDILACDQYSLPDDVQSGIKDYVAAIVNPASGTAVGDIKVLLRKVENSAQPYGSQDPKTFLEKVIQAFLTDGSTVFERDGSLPFRWFDIKALYASIFDPIQAQKANAAVKVDIQNSILNFHEEITEELRRRMALPMWTKVSDKTKEEVKAELSKESIDVLSSMLMAYRRQTSCERTAFSAKVETEFESIRKLFAAYRPEWEDSQAEADCISRPVPTRESSGVIRTALETYRDEAYPVKTFYQDVKDIVGGTYNQAIRINADVKKLRGCFRESDLPDAIRRQMTQSTFDGISGISGTSLKHTLGESALGDGRNSKFKWRFMVDFDPGEKSKTGSDGLQRDVTFGDLHKLCDPEMGELFSSRKRANPDDVFQTERGVDPFAQFEKWDDVRIVPAAVSNADGSARSVDYAEIDGFWLGVLHVDRSMTHFLTDSYVRSSGNLNAEMADCLRSEKGGGYSRLQHFSEAVKTGLILGAVSEIVKQQSTMVSAVGPVKYWAVDKNSPSKRCEVPRRYLDSNFMFLNVPGDLVVWAEAFQKDHADLFSQEEPGFAAFFKDLDVRENSPLLFGEKSSSFGLDYKLSAGCKGAGSLDTLSNLYQAIKEQIKVEVHNG